MKKVKFKKRNERLKERPDVFNKQTRTKVVQNLGRAIILNSFEAKIKIKIKIKLNASRIQNCLSTFCLLVRVFC